MAHTRRTRSLGRAFPSWRFINPLFTVANLGPPSGGHAANARAVGDGIRHARVLGVPKSRVSLNLRPRTQCVRASVPDAFDIAPRPVGAETEPVRSRYADRRLLVRHGRPPRRRDESDGRLLSRVGRFFVATMGTRAGSRPDGPRAIGQGAATHAATT
jgi:hypothetical protein